MLHRHKKLKKELNSGILKKKKIKYSALISCHIYLKAKKNTSADTNKPNLNVRTNIRVTLFLELKFDY